MTKNITHPVLVQPIEVAGVHASVGLHHALVAAGAPLFAGLRHMAHKDADGILELADIRGFPLSEIQVP